MKISTKKLRKLIQEELFYREFYSTDPTLKEFWGKKKATQKPAGPDKFSQPLEAADAAMSEVVSALWGPWDTPPDPTLLKKAQALHKEIKAAVDGAKK